MNSHDRSSSGAARHDMWMLGGGLALLAVVIPLVYAASKPDRAEVYAAASNAAEELRRTPVDGLVVTVFDVEDAIVTSDPATGNGKFRRSIVSELKVRSAGKDSRGDLFELTTDDGEHPVCLAVSVQVDLSSQEPSYPSVSVSDGPC